MGQSSEGVGVDFLVLALDAEMSQTLTIVCFIIPTDGVTKYKGLTDNKTASDLMSTLSYVLTLPKIFSQFLTEI